MILSYFHRISCKALLSFSSGISGLFSAFFLFFVSLQETVPFQSEISSSQAWVAHLALCPHWVQDILAPLRVSPWTTNQMFIA